MTKLTHQPHPAQQKHGIDQASSAYTQPAQSHGQPWHNKRQFDTYHRFDRTVDFYGH